MVSRCILHCIFIETQPLVGWQLARQKFFFSRPLTGRFSSHRLLLKTCLPRKNWSEANYSISRFHLSLILRRPFFMLFSSRLYSAFMDPGWCFGPLIFSMRLGRFFVLSKLAEEKLVKRLREWHPFCTSVCRYNPMNDVQMFPHHISSFKIFCHLSSWLLTMLVSRGILGAMDVETRGKPLQIMRIKRRCSYEKDVEISVYVLCMCVRGYCILYSYMQA